MSRLYAWMRKSITTICFLHMVIASFLPAQAQFVPVQQMRVSHWKEPADGYGFANYRWLNDNELVYVQHVLPQSQYVKRKLATGREEILQALTKSVRESNHDVYDLPCIFPSPNGKYLTWILNDNFGADSLVVAKIDGSITDFHIYKTQIFCPAWSEDSKWCFCFLTSTVHDDTRLQLNRTVFSAISTMNTTKPAVIRTYTIAQESPISGDRTTVGHLGLRQPYYHVNTRNSITLALPGHSVKKGIVPVEEFNIADTTKPVATHSIDVPASIFVDHAFISPNGHTIAWKLLRGANTEIWISNEDGTHMVQLGKLTHPEHGWPGGYDQCEIAWLPSGQGISFREAGELYVVYVDTHKLSE